jgi:hypothetical protein
MPAAICPKKAENWLHHGILEKNISRVVWRFRHDSAIAHRVGDRGPAWQHRDLDRVLGLPSKNIA